MFKKKKHLPAIKTDLKLISHGILHSLCSVDVSKSFFPLIVSIFIFPQYVFNKFFLVEKAFLN